MMLSTHTEINTAEDLQADATQIRAKILLLGYAASALISTNLGPGDENDQKTMAYGFELIADEIAKEIDLL